MARTVPERSAATGLRGWVAATVTLAVAGATFTGSASALVQIGHRAGMTQPWVLPVGLDGLAIVAATAIHGRRRADWWPWIVLLAADGVSAALQVAAAPNGLANRVAHAVPPLAALLAFELFLRATDVRVESKRGTAGQNRARLRPGEAGATPAASPARPPAPGVTVPTVVPDRRPATDEDVTTIVAGLDRSAGQPVSRSEVRAALRSAGLTIGTDRLRSVLADLDRPVNGPDQAGQPVDQHGPTLQAVR